MTLSSDAIFVLKWLWSGRTYTDLIALWERWDDIYGPCWRCQGMGV